MSFVFISKEFAESVKCRIQSNTDNCTRVREELKRKAEDLMEAGPWSVTFNESPAVSSNPHDYFSEGPYWWPNPDNPDGPYIRRDGEFNPERFTKHREDMRQMSYAVLYLSTAGYYFNEIKYIDKAVYLLNTWFVNEATKMNPLLEYGQAIRGVCDGRYIGIIDTIVLLPLVHGLGFIEECNDYDYKIKGVKLWFKKFLNWLTTSEKGLGERNHGNNHSNWWNTQVAAYAALVGEDDLLENCYDFFRQVILPKQLGVDGSFKDEITRTNSMHYSFFNLDASALLCEIAYHRGVDLWNYKTDDGKCIESAIRFMIPYYDNPFKWPYEEISGEIPDEDYCFQMAALRLGIKECGEINLKRGKDKYVIRDQEPIGPLSLLRL